jgi:hypothetical protein
LYTTIVDDGFEDALHVRIHSSLVDNYHCRQKVIVGINVQNWIIALRYIKNQHVKLIKVSDVIKEHVVRLEGQNMVTGVMLHRDLPILDVTPTQFQLQVQRRDYPFVMETMAKPFHQHCKELAETHKWIRIRLDLCREELTLQGLSSTTISNITYPVKLIDNPLQQETFCKHVREEKAFYTELLPFKSTNECAPLVAALMSYMGDTVIDNVYPAQRLALYATAHKLNSFVRLYLAPYSELLLEYVLKQSLTSEDNSSRVEGWIGFRVERKNDALLETNYQIQCFDDAFQSIKEEGAPLQHHQVTEPKPKTKTGKRQTNKMPKSKKKNQSKKPQAQSNGTFIL